MTDLFYKALEEKYRGSRAVIKSRLTVYLPFVLPLLQFYPKGQVVDLGCGRGEWLELTTEHGFHAQGVDLDEGMLQNARELGLTVHKLDALTFLQQLPDNSQTIVSGFHIAEHIAFDQLKQLVQEAKRVLVPGGLLILETPNPENLVVGTNSFYLDPTHHRPIPPQLLYFLPEHYGYSRQKIIRLQESPHLADSPRTNLMDVIGGVSPDYAVIAQKAAEPNVLQALDVPFSQEYGLGLHTLADQFQQSLTNRIESSQSEILARTEKIEKLVEHDLFHLKKHVEAMHSSWSWRLTWPLRLVGGLAFKSLERLKQLINKTLAWCLSAFQKPLTQAMAWVLARPKLTARINNWLLRWPHLYGHLMVMARQNGVLYPAFHSQTINGSRDPSQILAQLSPRTRQIYADLKSAIAQKNPRQH